MAQVPLLDEGVLLQAPPAKLPSEANAIQLIWGQVDSNFRGFQGVKSICCRVQGPANSKEKRGICRLQGGCMENESPCLLFKIKERYLEASLPILDNDYHIIQKITKLNDGFLIKKRNTRLADEAKEEYVNKLRRTTLNLAPADFKRRIRGDQILSAVQHYQKITLMEDYVGPNATR